MEKKKMKSKPKKKNGKKTRRKVMGRPKVFETDDSFQKLESLMRLMPTLEDTAAFFKCGATTIEDTIKQRYGLTFREFRHQNMVSTRLELIRKAIQKSDSSDTMHIFCLKNLCNWRDKQSDEENVNVTINLADRVAKARERAKKIKK